jgi:hypothetical protein
LFCYLKMFFNLPSLQQSDGTVCGPQAGFYEGCPLFSSSNSYKI